MALCDNRYALAFVWCDMQQWQGKLAIRSLLTGLLVVGGWWQLNAYGAAVAVAAAAEADPVKAPSAVAPASTTPAPSQAVQIETPQQADAVKPPAPNALKARAATNIVKVNADTQRFSGADAKALLNGHVQVDYRNVQINSKQAEIETDETGNPLVAHFFDKPIARRFSLEDNPPKTDTVEGNVLRMFFNDEIMQAEGNTVTYVTSVASDPFTIRADVQQFNNKTKLVTAMGGVTIDYKDMHAASPRALMKVNEQGKADRVVFSGGATLEQKENTIRGSVITVMVGSGNLVAENGVKTDVTSKESGRDIHITSDYQQYDKASDTYLASGAVRIIYDDYDATGSKAVFKLNGGEVDEIVLTGKSSITESDRTISADRIVIKTNPKQFDATGNVRTRFVSQHRDPAEPEGKPVGKSAGADASTPKRYKPTLDESAQLKME